MKSVFITGSSKGIGAATARLFRKEGYFVFLHGRNEKDLEALEKELGQKESILIGDLAKHQDIDTICKKLEDRVKFHGFKLQTLVNNAGIFKPQQSHEVATDLWESQFQVNIIGPARLTEKLIPLLKASAPASIINVSSSASLKATPGYGAYSATKAAMNHWTLSLAAELGADQIRVNAVLPGLVDTPIHSFHHLPAAEKEAAKLGLSGAQVLGRIGEPNEIAETIYFLASQKSKWTTGSLVTIDGGITLK